MLLIISCWMLTPVLVQLLGMPPAASRGATGMLATRGALTAIRWTVATATPILVTLGIAGAALAGTDTLVGTQEAAAQHRITASAAVTLGRGAGTTDPTGAAIRAVPGVRSATPVADTNIYVRSGEDVQTWTGQYIAGPSTAGVLALP